LASNEEILSGIIADSQRPTNEDILAGIVGEDPTAPEAPEATFGGVLTSTGAGLMAGATFVPQTISSGLQVLEEFTGIPLGGKQLDDIVDNAVDFWTKRIGKSRAERIFGSVGQTLGAIGSTAAVGGASAILPTLSIGSGLEKTAEALEEGAPKLNAVGAGLVTGATEYITEKIPIGILQKPAMGFIKRLAAGAISDIPGELIATATELSLVDKRILGKDHHLSTEDYVEILKDTVAVSALSSVGMSVGAQIAHNEVARAQPTSEAQETVLADSGARTNEIIKSIKNLRPEDPQPPIQNEKVEPVPVAQEAREQSKQEFDLSDQTNPEIPEEQLNLLPDTDPINIIEPQPDIEPSHETGTLKDSPVTAMLMKAKKPLKQRVKESAIHIRNAAIRGTVDVSGNLKREALKLGEEGKKVVQERILIAGAPSKAIQELDVWNKQIYSGLNTDDRTMLDGFIFTKRHQEIRKNKGDTFALPENLTDADLQRYIDAIPEQTRESLEQRAQVYWQAMDNQLLKLLDQKLITDEQYKNMSAQGEFYSPRVVLKYVDPIVGTTTEGGRKISVRDSGLNLLTKEGSEEMVETDSSLLLSSVVASTEARIAKNTANIAMLDLAENQPENGLVRESKIVGKTKEAFEVRNRRTGALLTGRQFETSREANEFIDEQSDKYVAVKSEQGIPVYEKAPPGFDKISVLKDGQVREMIMPKEMAQEWVKTDPILSSGWAQFFRVISGSAILRPMATGFNPEFAVTNTIRDLAHIWLTTKEYSAFTPKAAIQLGQDLTAVATDAAKRKGLYKIYIENGGGMEFLSHQGRPIKRGISGKVDSKIRQMEDVLGYFGETSEIWTRLALMNRAMRNGKTAREATAIARDYLDFSQGGNIIKAVDTVVPYLNASIQGTRGIVRAAQGNKALFTAKVSQIMGLAVALIASNRDRNPEAWDSIPDRDKVNNWNITTDRSFTDKDGNTKYYYFKLAKDQGQRVFATFAENLYKKALGEPVDVDQMVDAAVEFLPIVPTGLLPPSLEAVLGMMVNKDFWYREDIWKGPEVEPSAEFWPSTPEAFVNIGRVTGQSPERLRYAMRQLFTSGNIWTSLVDAGFKQLMDGESTELNNQVTEELIIKKPFVRRVMSATKPEDRLRNEVERTKIATNTRKFKQQTEFDIIVEDHLEGRLGLTGVTNYVRNQPLEDRSRLMSRFKATKRLQNVTNRRFWLNLLSLSPEDRARIYYTEWVKKDAAQQNEMEVMSRRVPGFKSKRFNVKLFKLKKLGGTNVR
jgi:hypothetical protein